jgi:SPP1 family predicted phage head-tail adaptor
MAGQVLLMRAGLLRHRLTIQEPTQTQNDFDEWVDSWGDWATVWGSIEPNLGKRYFEAKQANSEVEGLIRIRYREGIEPTMRITFGDRIFKIISIVHPFERKRELHILYKEELD